MADEQPAPPAEPAFLDEKTALERIHTIVSSASAIWFTQIGYLAFITITLLSVRDIDFFSVTARISLPLVEASVETKTFFWVAPGLAAILHAYFHFFLLKLWDAVAEAPPSVGTSPLAERVTPWPVVDWAIRRRADYKKAMVRRPMSILGSAVTGFLIWWATPLLIVAFWWRSMSAQDPLPTLMIGGALFLSLYTSVAGCSRARRTLRCQGLLHERRAPRWSGFVKQCERALNWIIVLVLWLGLIFGAPAILLVSVAGTEPHILSASVGQMIPEHWLRQPLRPANFAGAEIVQRPSDWQEPEQAEAHFRLAWCRDNNLPPFICTTSATTRNAAGREAWCSEHFLQRDNCIDFFFEIEANLKDEWQDSRSRYLSRLQKIDLTKINLTDANFFNAFLAGIRLPQGRLAGANLMFAELERANLFAARLEGANLVGAGLEGADLSWARLNWANLAGASLTGTDLRWAGLEGVILSRARLEGADLSWALLERADLSLARLEGADLSWARLQEVILIGATLHSTDWDGASLGASPAHSADFSEARNLTQSQLAQVIGDGDTILPRDAETGEQLYVCTCWAESPPNLEHLLQMQWPWERDRLRAAWLCPPGVAPQRTGSPPHPEPDGDCGD